MLTSARSEFSPRPNPGARVLVGALALALVLTTGCSGDRAAVLSIEEAPRSRSFEFRYTAIVREIPASAQEAFLWIPSPPETEDQQIRSLKVVPSLQYQLVTEERYDNRAFRFDRLRRGHRARGRRT